MTIQSAITARRNFDWLALAFILLGQMPTVLPAFLDAQNLGRAVSILGLLQLALKWYRDQLGLAGSDIPKKPPDDGSQSGV